jgi:hypothetical protein
MLLLHVDESPDERVTLITSPIEGFEVHIRGAHAKRIPQILAEVAGRHAH